MQDELLWAPMPKQYQFISCPADDVGFGGARGGGKSDAIPGDWIAHEETYGPHVAGMAFRRERTQLIDLIERAKQILIPLGHKWRDKDSVFHGPKGGRLRFAYLESDSDADAYQGHNYTRLYPEEMGTFPNEAPIKKLWATLRSGHGVPCQMKGTCNPGGAGHHWVKSRYKLGGKLDKPIITEFEVPIIGTRRTVRKTRVFIPSKVQDNKYLGDDYIANLAQVGSPQLVRAWLEGDWDVIDGAFFDCWSATQHVIEPFEIPKDWLRFRSADWGSAKPFSVNWFAVVGDDYQLADSRILPRGALVQYREYYGMKPGQPNVGLKMSAEDVADQIRVREAGEKIQYGVLDPAAFAQDGGPSIAERMADRKVHFQRADNKRVANAGAMGGWDLLRRRLIGTDGVPMIYFFKTCEHIIRTLPALQHDQHRPEDVDTDGEDHGPDSVRYGCASRPWIPGKTIEKPEFPQFPIMAAKGNSFSYIPKLLLDRQHRRRRAERSLGYGR